MKQWLSKDYQEERKFGGFYTTVEEACMAAKAIMEAVVENGYIKEVTIRVSCLQAHYYLQDVDDDMEGFAVDYIKAFRVWQSPPFPAWFFEE